MSASADTVDNHKQCKCRTKYVLSVSGVTTEKKAINLHHVSITVGRTRGHVALISPIKQVPISALLLSLLVCTHNVIHRR